jgi:hypothetical protein
MMQKMNFLLVLKSLKLINLLIFDNKHFLDDDKQRNSKTPGFHCDFNGTS